MNRKSNTSMGRFSVEVDIVNDREAPEDGCESALLSHGWGKEQYEFMEEAAVSAFYSKTELIPFYRREHKYANKSRSS